MVEDGADRYSTVCVYCSLQLVWSKITTLKR